MSYWINQKLDASSHAAAWGKWATKLISNIIQSFFFYLCINRQAVQKSVANMGEVNKNYKYSSL